MGRALARPTQSMLSEEWFSCLLCKGQRDRILHCLLAPHPRASVVSPLACATLSCYGEGVTSLLSSLSSQLWWWGGGELSPGNHLCTTLAAFNLALSCS